MIEVLLKNGLYEKVFNKSYMGNGDFCFDSLNENEIDLLSMFECIEPELLENCYIDSTTPDNPWFYLLNRPLKDTCYINTSTPDLSLI